MESAARPRSDEKTREKPAEFNAMNEYEVTFTNGEVVVVAAWTPEAAQAVAEEDADLYGCGGLSAVGVMLLDSPALEV
jgi:hypothetical protein